MSAFASVAYDLHPSLIERLASRDGTAPLNRTGRPWPRAEVEAAARGRRGLVVGALTAVDADLLAGAGSQLAVVASNSVGYDHLLPAVEFAAGNGIALTHTPEVLAPAVAEQALTFMAWFLRRPLAGHRVVLEGRFEAARGALVESPGFEGRVLGIVGLGSTGCELARRADALGMALLGCDIDPRRPREYERRSLAIERLPLHEVLAHADVVSLHVDLNPTSWHLVDAAALAAMRPGAGLVNTSRGAVVDEAALAGALASGHVGWAALDVFENEPEIHPGLAAVAAAQSPDVDRLLMAPHVASGTARARRAMAERAVHNLDRALAGDAAALDLVPPLARAAGPGWGEAFAARVARGATTEA